MKKKITIKEIAQQAGVSVTTVSRVINNHPSVKEEKRKLVQKIIDEQEFQPSMLARGMVSSVTRNLAVVVPDINNPYFTALVSHLETASYEAGYSLLLFNTMAAGKQKALPTTQQEQSVFHTILEKRIDGVFILGGEIDKDYPSDTYIQALTNLNQQIPVVVIGQKDPIFPLTFIERDLVAGTKAAVQHLLALGHKKIGFLGGESGIKITSERLATFKKTMSLYGEFDPDFVYLSDFYTKDGYESMESLLSAEKQPSAVITINDKVAIGAIRALTDHGLNCPKDLKIVSCDAFPDGEYTVPRLTTVDQKNATLAVSAMESLLALINDKPLITLHKHTPELIIRESCGIQTKGE